jgi:cell division protein FtsZ
MKGRSLSDICGEQKPTGIQKFRILGIGGSGTKAIDHMMTMGMEGVEFLAANADLSLLNRCKAPVKILLGQKVAKAKGSKGNLKKGISSLKETTEELEEVLKDTDTLIIVAGHGCATDISSVKLASEAFLGLKHPPFTISVVTTPFSWESDKSEIAEEIYKELSSFADCPMTISSSSLEEEVPEGCTFEKALKVVRDAFFQLIFGIANSFIERAKRERAF